MFWEYLIPSPIILFNLIPFLFFNPYLVIFVQLSIHTLNPFKYAFMLAAPVLNNSYNVVRYLYKSIF